MGDNGSDAPLGGADDIAVAAPFRGKKGDSWEGGMRVPFIASWGEVDHGNVWQRRWPITASSLMQGVAMYDIFPH